MITSGQIHYSAQTAPRPANQRQNQVPRPKTTSNRLISLRPSIVELCSRQSRDVVEERFHTRETRCDIHWPHTNLKNGGQTAQGEFIVIMGQYTSCRPRSAMTLNITNDAAANSLFARVPMIFTGVERIISASTQPPPHRGYAGAHFLRLLANASKFQNPSNHMLYRHLPLALSVHK